jgi:tRNA pseudouridine-54 N-methylase
MTEELNYKVLSEEDLENLLKRAFELEDKARAIYDVVKGIDVKNAKDFDLIKKAREHRNIIIAERVAIQEALTLRKG